jgi:hypothetical protein
MRHLPGHNSSYKRDILMSYGRRLEDFMEAESVFHRHLRARGHELWLEAGTCTTHLNFSTWSSWVPAQYYNGRQFAAAWSQEWSFPRRLLFTVASPLIPFIRLWQVQKQVRRGDARRRLIRLLPHLLVGLVANGLGHMTGYAAGFGDCRDKVSKYEFNRVKSALPASLRYNEQSHEQY